MNSKRILSAILLAYLFTFSSCVQDNSAKINSNASATDTLSNESGRLLPKQLRYIPFGLVIDHYPNPCYPEREGDKYVWKHNTTVKANKDLQIIEYGSFVYTKKGWYLRIRNDVTYFDEHYGTKNGKLKKDSLYVDPLSFRYSDSLYAGDAMWYYIAVDEEGNKYKGIGPIETEGITLNELNKRKGLDIFSTSESKVSWVGYGEIGTYSLTGTLKLKSATYRVKNDTLSSAHILFDLNTIESKQEGLAGHLKGEDFFESGKYPVAEFTLKKPAVIGANMIVNGILTIKGISKDITIPVKHTLNNKKHEFAGVVSFDRTKFNIKYNSKSFFGNLGDQAIKDNIDLAFELKAEK